MAHQKKNTSWIETISKSYSSERTALIDESENMTGKTTTIIAGIPCEGSSKTQKTKLLKSFIKEAEEEMNIRRMLQEKGLKAEGLLPTAILKEMIGPLPFYTFKNINDKGKVEANGKKFMKMHSMTETLALLLITMILSAVSFFVMYQKEFEVSGNIKGVLGLWSVLSTVLSVWMCFEAGTPPTSSAEPMVSNLDDFCAIVVCIALFPFVLVGSLFVPNNLVSEKRKKRSLWPSKSDTENVSGDLVGIVLSPAPAEVQSALLKLQKSGLEVKPYLIVHENAFKPIMDGETMKVLTAKYDPIACFDVGNFTVLYRQYGEFEQEKELVKAIKERFNIIKEKHLMPSN